MCLLQSDLDSISSWLSSHILSLTPQNLSISFSPVSLPPTLMFFLLYQSPPHQLIEFHPFVILVSYCHLTSPGPPTYLQFVANPAASCNWVSSSGTFIPIPPPLLSSGFTSLLFVPILNTAHHLGALLPFSLPPYLFCSALCPKISVQIPSSNIFYSILL